MNDTPARERDHEMEVTIVGFAALVLVLIAGNDLFFEKWWALLAWLVVASLGVARIFYLRKRVG